MASVHALNPKADLLRREQALAANVNAAKGLQEILASNLGPKGTQKMLVGGAGQIKITKDGNVLLKEMHIQHPTAAVIARAATAQDIVTGDGSTSDILLIGEIMKLGEREISEGVHPRKLAEGLDIGRVEALKFLECFKKNQPITREFFEDVARCSLRSKLDTEMADQLTSIVTDAILCLLGGKLQIPENPLDLFMVEVLHMKQGIRTETSFIKGMVMDHGCRHPDMPSQLKNAYVLTCNVSLEYEKTEVNSAFFYSSVTQRSRLADAERRFTDQKVQKIIDLKRKVCTEENRKTFVIFNQKGIDPPSLHMLAQEGIMALRRVKRRNMERLTLCCGGQPINAVDDLKESDLGFAESVWEISMGDEKFTFVEGVADPRSCCILIKAPSDHEVEQIKDAVRDGLRAIKNVLTDRAVVPGAGAFEIACHHHLKNYAEDHVEGKARLGVHLLAEALLVIPKTLAKNAGYDPRDVLLNLQSEYRKMMKANPDHIPGVGIDLNTGEIQIPSVSGIWDGVCVKRQMLVLVTTLTSQLLLVDEIIKAGKQMGNQQGPN